MNMLKKRGIKSNWLKITLKPGEKLPPEVTVDIALSTKDEICIRCKQPLGEGDADCDVCRIVAQSMETMLKEQGPTK